MTVLNKIDALDDEEREFIRETLEEVAGPVLLMSGVSREGTTDVLRALRAQISEERLRQKPIEDNGSWQP